MRFAICFQSISFLNFYLKSRFDESWYLIQNFNQIFEPDSKDVASESTMDVDAVEEFHMRLVRRVSDEEFATELSA